MKESKKKFFESESLEKRNQSIASRLANRLDNIRRKMSRGASNIFRTIKTRAAWGNKQLWGWKEKKRDHSTKV